MTADSDTIDLRPSQTHDPLHGVTLETILKQLVEQIGWEEMGRAVEIRCFTLTRT